MVMGHSSPAVTAKVYVHLYGARAGRERRNGGPLEDAQQETVNKGDDDLRHAQYKNAADDEGSKGKREILELGPQRLK
jgi:hypothetical protein